MTDRVEPDGATAEVVDPVRTAEPEEPISGNGLASEQDLAVEAVEGQLPIFLIDEEFELELPPGSRTVVVSDLHLPAVATPVSTSVADGLAGVLAGMTGPAAFVIAGDGFEMLAGPPDVAKILDAHPQFVAAVARFAEQDGHHVVLLSGNHDGQIAWDGTAAAVLTERLGVERFALHCDLVVATDHGPQRVRIVHGNQSDPYNTFEDPWSPVDTPFGHHVVRDVLPQLESRQAPGSLLEGVQWLDGDITDFMGSRLFYRKIVGKLWLLAVPFVAILLLRLLTFLPGVRGLLHDHADRWLLGFGLLVAFMVIVAAVATVATLLRVNRALRETAVSARSDPASHNAPPRAAAARLVTQGYAGMVSGHTHEPELSVVGDGFYANTGSGTSSVVARPARFRLPHPFVTIQRFSYLEIRGGTVLELKLWLREQPLESPVLLERLALAAGKSDMSTTTLVASLPNGPTWPIDATGLQRWVVRRRVRRVAAGVLLITGILNVVFASLWPIQATRSVDHWLPFGIHPLSVVESVVAGLALCGLARGVRRGLRPVWVATLFVLLITTTDRLIQGRSLTGSGLALLFCLWLLFEHKHFRVQLSGVTRLFVWLAAGGLVVIAATAGLGNLLGTGHRQRVDLVFLLLVIVILLLLLLVALPGKESRRTGTARQEAFARARAIIRDHGGDTLDYFALRDDKSWFFTGESVVAYSVISGVMLVSPDPIGPPEDRAEVWSDVMDMAQDNNWVPSVLAASQSWLPIYRATGLVDHYIGDEAIVDCSTFSLKGKSMKSLRGAYNRIKKSGCRVECFESASDLSDELKQQLLELMTDTRQGEAERGYSMTLSRIFDPRDDGLLLAVCFSADGRPMAFNQYVPATEVDGFSLDLMRRTNDPGAPNGLTDFVIIETIQWMAERGMHGLGLNFATMRAVVAGESTGGPWTSLERSVLHRFSETLQIESLWRFNQKYDPMWNPRYVVTGPFLPLARSSVAIARAEAVTEIPVIGGLLRTREPTQHGDG
ncbi:MAG: phosphatidylglycerol lysyltransferase domain-containing protein [Acidimicrobiales bacterium]